MRKKKHLDERLDAVKDILFISEIDISERNFNVAIQNKEYIHTNLIDKDEFNKLISYSIENNYEFILNCVDKRYKYGKFDDLNMLNYEEGKDYTILSYESDGMKEIKVPNVLMPFGVNNKKVYKFKEGKFELYI